MCDPVRQLRFPGLQNTFIITKLKLDELSYVRYAVVERQTMTLMVTSHSLATLIYFISSLLADMDQNDLDNYLATCQEFNN